MDKYEIAKKEYDKIGRFVYKLTDLLELTNIPEDKTDDEIYDIIKSDEYRNTYPSESDKIFNLMNEINDRYTSVKQILNPL